MFVDQTFTADVGKQQTWRRKCTIEKQSIPICRWHLHIVEHS